jgi:hypothetical protein
MSDIGPVDYQPQFDIRPTAPIAAPGGRSRGRPGDHGKEHAEDRDQHHGEDHDTDAAGSGPAPAPGAANAQHVLNVTA